jgi:ribosomal protein L28
VNKRRFLPNLHRVRVSDGGGVVRKVVCAACIKSGRIAKA